MVDLLAANFCTGENHSTNTCTPLATCSLREHVDPTFWLTPQQRMLYPPVAGASAGLESGGA